MAEIEKRPVKIVETVLRDAHQSLLATRMSTEQMLPIIDKMDKVGYHAVECWGGATFDSCLRFLKEDQLLFIILYIIHSFQHYFCVYYTSLPVSNVSPLQIYLNTFKYICPLTICLPLFFRVFHHQSIILCALNTMQAPFSWHLPDS